MRADDRDLAANARFSLTLHVADVERSVEWYRRVLGVTPDYRGSDTGQDGHAAEIVGIRLAGVRVWLSQADTKPAAPGRASTVALLTREDLASLRETLEARGAEIDDTTAADRFVVRSDGVRESIGAEQTGGGGDSGGQDGGFRAEFLWLRDPDANRLEFCRFVKS